MKNVVFFEPKCWWKNDIYWLLKISCWNFSMMGNTVFFEPRSWWKRWYLLITEKFLFWTFRWWKIRSFFEARSWWKDHIYWLMRSSCFELLSDVNTIFFSAKKLMGRWYLLVLFELSMIFQDLGNTVFRAVNKTINYLSCQNNSSCIQTNYTSAWPN